MVPFDNSDLMRSIKAINSLHQMLVDQAAILRDAPNLLPNGLPFSEAMIREIINDTDNIKNISDKLGLDAVGPKGDHLINFLQNPFPPPRTEGNQVFFLDFHVQQIGMRSGVLVDTVHEQLRLKSFLMLRPENKRFYEQPEPLFGSLVDGAFPGFIAENISDAGKCLAFERGTACVFHLMRAMEAIVQRLGDKLQVTIIDKNNNDLDWGPIVANMQAPVEAKPRGPEKDKWSEALTLLVHVKQAWRHPTMHPKETYTPEQAKEVFDATNSFMNCLARLI